MENTRDRKNRIYKQEQRRRHIVKTRRKKAIRRNLLFVIIVVLLAFIVIKLVSCKSHNESMNVTRSKNTAEQGTEKRTVEETTSAAAKIKYKIGTPQKRSIEEVYAKLKKYAKKDKRMAYIYENRKQYSNDMLKALINTPEMVDFVRGYLTADKKVSGGITKAEKKKKFPLFNQWDTRWANVKYGDSNIGIAGCGPTCLSMVIFSLTRDTKATPNQIAKFSEENGYYVDGIGTAWALMTDVASEYGVSSYQIACSELNMKEQLDAGELLICAVGPGDFTSGGHFIVIYGYDEEGFMVNDPNSIARSEKKYTFAQLQGQVRSMWTYSF